jgi:hypothetical protein
MNDLDKILNIAPNTEEQKVENLPAVVEPVNNEAEKDYSYARENLYDVIEKGQEALFDMLDVAKQSQHPRAYEVLSGLINTLVAANKDLVDLQKKKKDLFKQEEAKEKTVTNNNLFVGSTAELQKLIQNKRDNG